MTQYVHRCLIVQAFNAPLARALCSSIAPNKSGSGMLTTPVSASGLLPATHYISQGALEDIFAGLLPLTIFNAFGVAVTTPGQPETIVTLAKGVVTLAQVNALLAAVDVTTQDPFTALSRLGLNIINAQI